MNPYGIPFKIMKDHGKIFDALAIPKSLQKYILHESHSCLGHNASNILCQEVKQQCCCKCLKEASLDFVRDTVNSVNL